MTNKNIIRLFQKNLLPNHATVKVYLMDAGALGGVHERWKKINNNLTVIGFEPDKKGFIELSSNCGPGEIWHNTALWSQCGKKTLYITKWPTNTSVLKPNRECIDQLYANCSDFDIVNEISIECQTVDSISEENDYDIDVIKLDTQGSELEILKGGMKALKNSVFAIEVEVEFVELYQNQPLFADIDLFLRDMGFQLIDCGNLLFHKWPNLSIYGGKKGKLICADALYFKDMDATVDLLRNNGAQKLLRLIQICISYGYPDFAILICENAAENMLIENNQKIALVSELKKCVQKNARFPNVRGRGRIVQFLRKLADAILPISNSYISNKLGN